METENLLSANDSGCLWPPIADALDTFRRRATSAGAYERIWRLIHVWEAISITLASAAISYLRETGKHPDIFLRVREFCHGRSWKPLVKTFDRQQGALHGSIDRWIDILFELSNYSYQIETPFLFALKRFLDTETISLRRLVSAWAVTCAVPGDSQRADRVAVKHALRNINMFRNRLAHVPFPHDPIEHVATALEDITEELFSVDPLPWKLFPKAEDNSPLTGALLHRKSLFRGCVLFHSHRDPPPQEIQFLFPCPPSAHQQKGEFWRAEPFIHIDAMTRPYVVTRLIDETLGTWEYTRFRAEANAVITRDEPAFLSLLRIPEASEYSSDEEEEEEPAPLGARADVAGSVALDAGAAPAMTFKDAMEAIRNENYDPAIAFFADLAAGRPEYHIGWLRLGYAKREKAMRLWAAAPEQALQLFREAVADLTRATGHRDAPSRAQAYYERSKAHYHLARLIAEEAGSREIARQDAWQATQLAPDARFRSWLEYLERTYGPAS